MTKLIYSLDIMDFMDIMDGSQLNKHTFDLTGIQIC